MKHIFFVALVLANSFLFAQETEEKGSIFGGFESNSQWLLDDDGLGFIAPEDQLRANNYFQLIKLQVVYQ